MDGGGAGSAFPTSSSILEKAICVSSSTCSSLKTRTPCCSSAAIHAAGSASSCSKRSRSIPSTSAPTVGPSGWVVIVLTVPPPSQIPAAVHIDLLARDVPGLLGAEEDAGRRNVLGRAQPPQRRPGDHRIDIHGAGVDRAPHHGGVDDAGGNGVHRDLMPRQVEGECLGEG